MDIIKALAKELNLKEEQITATVELLDEGNTVPFIARYRKEVTGSLDDVTLRNLEDRLNYLRKLDERRGEISALIEAQGKLTPEITAALDRAVTLVELEDIYRPYRPKRKTRASVAREKGLEPLAELLMAQEDKYEPTIPEAAAAYIDEEKGVASADEALAGACDIIAEDISNSADYRKMLRTFTFQNGSLVTKAAKEEDSVYKDYYEFSEPIKKLRQHRVLAINRGEKEEFLKVAIEVSEDDAVAKLAAHIVKNKESEAIPYLMATIRDSYNRLIFPAIEREIRSDLFDEASEGALKVFAENLRNLLMISPLKGKTVLGYDPGYRTGCKLAVVDSTGKVLDTAVIYPTKPREDIPRSRETVERLIRRYGVDVVAIGNGTASRESEQFIAETLKGLDRDVKYTIVSEAGASVYSASKLGAEEFPDFDVTERSAVSIARRLQDPLAELVKIEPQAIGVGQYQHDMKPARMNETLGGVVEDCVNAVGVDVNTASYSLLSYIAGISTTAAKNIVAYREANGEFKNRAEILKVPKIGAKAYEQCAGFLRVPDSKELLDNTGVHPESYELTNRLLALFDYTEESVKNGEIGMLRSKVTLRGVDKVCAQLSCGEPTLMDIIGELEKPGRDIRDTAPAPVLRSDVLEMKDLTEGMLLKGTVRNVVDFGAFVDIGVHEDGLLHISEMSDRFISHPRELFSVGDVIEVRIKGVDLARKRISLSRKNLNNGQG
ncbi:MAG: RNA-binding transcriptional accessory protein [Clostridia bacterium]|nr:RNA-binding transcriptional accessory protein [Clostridia bacterium]